MAEMARNFCTVRVFVVVLGGVADCLVCGRLISFKLPIPELDRLATLRCPACGGSCLPAESSFVADVRAEPVP